MSKKTPKKNAAASALARKRWAAVDPKTRSAIMRRTVQARWAKGGK